jgi:hypothetical protein
MGSGGAERRREKEYSILNMLDNKCPTYGKHFVHETFDYELLKYGQMASGCSRIRPPDFIFQPQIILNT